MEKFTYIFLEVTDLNINNQEGQLPELGESSCLAETLDASVKHY